MSGIRVSINYFEGYPELEAELAKFHSRARPSRIRLLASIGLLALQKGQSMVAHESDPELDGEKNADGKPPAIEGKPPKRGPGRPKKEKSSTKNDKLLKNIFGQAQGPGQ